MLWLNTNGTKLITVITIFGVITYLTLMILRYERKICLVLRLLRIVIDHIIIDRNILMSCIQMVDDKFI